jgi:hypothetical protein
MAAIKARNYKTEFVRTAFKKCLADRRIKKGCQEFDNPF